MERIFGFDIGTTSIGFAVIDHSPSAATGEILRLGVRIFPEARDPDGVPFNQQRRQKRMVRRQLRRRRQRRRLLNETLSTAGLLPPFGSEEWREVMKSDPYALRKRGLTEELSAHEFGRALYHLAQRRHFSGRELIEEDDDAADASDEKETKSDRESTSRELKAKNLTLGAWLAEKKSDAKKGTPPVERRRGVHAHRSDVKSEFKKLWEAQVEHHSADDELKGRIEEAIFAQRPVFWRTNTLGSCRFMPGEELCPRGSWLSQQKRMLEKQNNLTLGGGNARPLDDEERGVILKQLQTQASMSWAGVRSTLKPLYKARGEPGGEKRLKFNLEVGGDKKLPGNAVEAKLVKVFGNAWNTHPHKQAIREALHQRLWSADYGRIGDQRVVILPAKERDARRAEAAGSFVNDFAISADEARAIKDLAFPTGWEPFSTSALRAFMPRLEAGVRFGTLIGSPDPEWKRWRDEAFPNQDRPTGEVLDRLPSPAMKEERERIAKLRNPTIVRTQNELRKVVNNLIGLYGKPDIIRVEVARDVGKSKREREEIQNAIHKQERRRKEAIRCLESNEIANPSRGTVEKWLLWKEGHERCPYTGDQIGFDDLFRTGLYEVEHIWPRSKSFDDSFRNKTLCRRDINIAKGNKTPFGYLSHDADRWADVQRRLESMIAPKNGIGMSRGKVKRFLAESIPEDFASRQLNDTGYAAREAVSFLRRLWPDIGPNAPVTVQAVTGRVTAQLRKLWGLNNILADDGEKTRADHRHHAIDALTVACVDPGMTSRLSHYWQDEENSRTRKPELSTPWPSIRADAGKAVSDIVVSHRVRKKISGPLHKEKVYGDTKKNVNKDGVDYRIIVQRVPIEELTASYIESDDLKSSKFMIRDKETRKILREHVVRFGGDVKAAMASKPTLGPEGPTIRKVRLVSKRQIDGLAVAHNGLTDPENKHHMAIYQTTSGSFYGEIVSLFEASQRISKSKPVVSRTGINGAKFVMSLSKGDILNFVDVRGEYWVVRELKSNGQITLVSHTEARPTKQATPYKPRVSGLMARSPRKLSVDPIGRIRPAND